MALSPGTRLGPYEITAQIGAGGMGEVYKAKDTRLDRTVAIKVLPTHVASDPQFRERFEREGKAISQLNHPHICTLYDVGRQDVTDFLVMEYLEGADARRSSDQRRAAARPGADDTRSRSPTRSTRRIARASSIAISSPATSC